MTPRNRKDEFVRRIMGWGQTHLREFPWRLEKSPLEILIAEVFLQKTPADRVARRYDALVSAFGQDASALDDDALVKRFQDLGLSKRIKWLVRARRQIEEQYQGEVPRTRKELLSLPGVGLYTANAVLCFAFGDAVPLVDTNVARILARVFDRERSRSFGPSSEIYILAESLVPKSNPKLYNFSLLDHGALVCNRQPLCDECPVQSLCTSFSSNAKRGT